MTKLCEKVVCVTKLCVTQLCVCVRRLCVNVCEDAEADADGRSGGGADLKTRTPHNFAGKNQKQNTSNRNAVRFKCHSPAHTPYKQLWQYTYKHAVSRVWQRVSTDHASMVVELSCFRLLCRLFVFAHLCGRTQAKPRCTRAVAYAGA